MTDSAPVGTPTTVKPEDVVEAAGHPVGSGVIKPGCCSSNSRSRFIKASYSRSAMTGSLST